MYKEGTGAKLSEELGRCYTGHIKDALVYIAEGAEGDGFGIDRDADMIMRSMKGFGTKDEQLVYR
jgi:annexin A7/11